MSVAVVFWLVLAIVAYIFFGLVAAGLVLAVMLLFMVAARMTP